MKPVLPRGTKLTQASNSRDPPQAASTTRVGAFDPVCVRYCDPIAAPRAGQANESQIEEDVWPHADRHELECVEVMPIRRQ